MAQTLLTLIMLTMSCYASARTSWVHIIGIDEKHPSQNYSVFYQSAQDFESRCANSPLHLSCTLFVNPDISLSADYMTSLPSLPHNNFKPQYGLKSMILSKVMDAEAGDTLVISLHDHGAPSAGESASCIWQSSYDNICASDLRQILKARKPGVKTVN